MKYISKPQILVKTRNFNNNKLFYVKNSLFVKKLVHAFAI